MADRATRYVDQVGDAAELAAEDVADALERLEPMHLRVLGQGLWPAYVFELRKQIPETVAIDPRMLPTQLGISPGAARASCDALVAAGFLAAPQANIAGALKEYDDRRRREANSRSIDFHAKAAMGRHLD